MGKSKRHAARIFGEMLSEAIRTIKICSGKSMAIVQDELGFDLKYKGGAAIERWRKGNLPPDSERLEALAKLILVQSCNKLNRDWFERFLNYGNHPYPKMYCDDLFSTETNHENIDRIDEGTIRNDVLGKHLFAARFQENLQTWEIDIPIEKVSEPGPIPPISQIPFRYHESFVGRIKELGDLAKSLMKNKIAIISGLGGVGKTQLAVEFAYRYGQYFAGGVFWFDFSNSANVDQEVATSGGIDGLDLFPKFDKLELKDQVRLVRQTWQQPIPRLLIFDNCQDKDLLDYWLPTIGGCYVIVTSRDTHWSKARGVFNLELDVLQRDDSLLLLRKYIPSIGEPEAIEIAIELGYLPLALHLAGSYLDTYQDDISPLEYLNNLRTEGLSHKSMLGHGTKYSPTKHELHVKNTIHLSFNRLDPMNKNDLRALELIARASWFSSGKSIPRNLLFRSIGLDKDKFEFGSDAINRLFKLGLATRSETGGIIIHRLVSEFIREIVVEGDKPKSDVEETAWRYAQELSKSADPRVYSNWITHFKYVTKQSQENENERSAGLSHELGNYFNMIGEYDDAYFHLERAYKLRTTLFGKQNLDSARSQNDMGVVLTQMGRLEEARVALEESLTIRRKSVHLHIDTAESLNNLGNLLDNLNQLHEARQLLENSLEIYTQLPGPAHSDRAQTLNNLGAVLLKLGEVEQAKSFFEQAKDIWQKELGKDHPHSAIAITNLGSIYWKQGNIDLAKENFKEAVELYEKSNGSGHPRTATAYNNLGATLREAGDYQDAQDYLQKALDVFQMIELDSLNEANVRRHLGQLYEKINQPDQAKKHYRIALNILTNWEEKTSSEHPLTKLILALLDPLEPLDID